jgi:predicted metal-binding protein
MEDLKKQALEEQLLELPLVQYAWMDIGDIEFSENVRHICRTECPRYGTSWSCPPAVGTVEECRERCVQRLLKCTIRKISRRHSRPVPDTRL